MLVWSTSPNKQTNWRKLGFPQKAVSLTGFQIVAHFKQTQTVCSGMKHCAWLNIFLQNRRFFFCRSRHDAESCTGIPQSAFQFPTLKLWWDCNTSPNMQSPLTLCLSATWANPTQTCTYCTFSTQHTLTHTLTGSSWHVKEAVWFLWPESCEEHVHMLHNWVHTQSRTNREQEKRQHEPELERWHEKDLQCWPDDAAGL